MQVPPRTRTQPENTDDSSSRLRAQGINPFTAQTGNVTERDAAGKPRWKLLSKIPGGQYAVDQPFPLNYAGSYECGGRTCNGKDALRVSPFDGTYTAELKLDTCR